MRRSRPRLRSGQIFMNEMPRGAASFSGRARSFDHEDEAERRNAIAARNVQQGVPRAYACRDV